MNVDLGFAEEELDAAGCGRVGVGDGVVVVFLIVAHSVEAAGWGWGTVYYCCCG